MRRLPVIRPTPVLPIALSGTIMFVSAFAGAGKPAFTGLVRAADSEEFSADDAFDEARKKYEDVLREVADAEKAASDADQKVRGLSKGDAKKQSKEREEALKEALKIRQKKQEAALALLQKQATALSEFRRIRSKKTVPYLKQLYRSEKNVAILAAITKILGRIGSLEAVQAIVLTGASAGVKVGKEHRSMLVEDPYASESIAEALAMPLEPAAEKWFLKKGRSTPALRRNPKLWRRIIHSIDGFKSEERVPALIDELARERSPEIQVVLLEVLEGHKDPKVASAARRFLKSRSADVQVAALLCLFNQDTKKYKKQFVTGLKSPYPKVRLLCLRMLADLKDKKIVTYAAKLLDDKDTKVQLTAIRTLLHRGGKAVIPPLIERMGKAEGRTLEDLSDALARLTGRDLGPVAVQWESWWAQNKDRDDPFLMLSPEEYSSLLAERGTEQTQVITYYGLRILADNVVFIIDTSQSMSKEYVPKEERAEKGRGKRAARTTATSGAATSKKRAGAKKKTQRTRSRMEVAKAELLKVIKGLKDGRRFNVIGFDSVVKDFVQDALRKPPERLEPMNPEIRQQVQGFVQKTRPGGMTHMLSAVKTALSYADVDTIYLLSDGAPTAESGTTEEILTYLRIENRLRNVKIHTIGFHLQPLEKRFLTRLADENFGVFVER